MDIKSWVQEVGERRGVPLQLRHVDNGAAMNLLLGGELSVEQAQEVQWEGTGQEALQRNLRCFLTHSKSWMAANLDDKSTEVLEKCVNEASEDRSKLRAMYTCVYDITRQLKKSQATFTSPRKEKMIGVGQSPSKIPRASPKSPHKHQAVKDDENHTPSKLPRFPSKGKLKKPNVGRKRPREEDASTNPAPQPLKEREVTRSIDFVNYVDEEKTLEEQWEDAKEKQKVLQQINGQSKIRIDELKKEIGYYYEVLAKVEAAVFHVSADSSTHQLELAKEIQRIISAGPSDA